LLKLLKEGTILKEDYYMISEEERLELIEYRKTFNKFLRLYTNYTKYYSWIEKMDQLREMLRSLWDVLNVIHLPSIMSISWGSIHVWDVVWFVLRLILLILLRMVLRLLRKKKVSKEKRDDYFSYVYLCC